MALNRNEKKIETRHSGRLFNTSTTNKGENQERRPPVSLYLDEVPYYSNYLASGLIHGSDDILHGSIHYMKGAEQESIRNLSA